MKQFESNASQTTGDRTARRRRGVEGGPPILREIARLQAGAGNAAVAASLGDVMVQRHDVDAGADAAPGAGQLPTPNPVIAALWKISVQNPLHAAANAMSDDKPDYKTAFDQGSSAEEHTIATATSLPDGDPRVVQANYLSDDLAVVETMLAPRADFPIWSDDKIAAQLGKLEWDAAVVGESLGGDPAARQQVVPGLGKEQPPADG